MKFWDASAVVPLCVQQPLSDVVQEVLVQDSAMVVWWGTRTECISALVRQVREGTLSPADERAARRLLQALMQAWTEMQPSEALRSTAERLLAVHPLRTADALQLAAAICGAKGSQQDRAWCRWTGAWATRAIERASPFFPRRSEVVRLEWPLETLLREDKEKGPNEGTTRRFHQPRQSRR